jgi:cytochrome c peroxidase
MRRTTAVLGMGVLALVSCGKEPERHRKKVSELTAAVAGVEVDPAKTAMFAPLPESFESKTNPATDDRTALGKLLFHDPRLSKDRALSCNSCHELGHYGTDARDFSPTSKGRKEERNTPTVYDAAGQFAQFWDGRSETVEDAVKTHLLDPAGMAMLDDEQVVAAVKKVPEYSAWFKKAFPDDAEPITFDNVAKAIGAFERKLVTPSKWDRFLGGDKGALTDDEKKGFLKFVEVGCPTCHVGPLVGGTMYQKLGKEKPWPNLEDKGRSRVTKAASDDMMYKVAQLRNIEHTAPYFHDATGKTLEGSVKTMALHQLNKELSDDDTKSIVLWLKTLSGSIPANAAQKPDVPGLASAAPASKTAAPPASK